MATGDDAADLGGSTVPAVEPGAEADLVDAVRAFMSDAWRPPGYTVPHPDTYPWQWLWDSCFHSLVWCALGDAERALAEVRHAFAHQHDDGFVPHMTYWDGGDGHTGFWGVEGPTSSITQPPMYGHTLRALAEAGVDVPDELVDRAAAAMRHLLDHRPRVASLVPLCHPWESGADDSPRWDDFCPGGWDRDRWREVKAQLVHTCDRSASGAPVRNPSFEVASAGFNGLVAFNARELAVLAADDGLASAAVELVAALEARWNPDAATWVDAGAAASGSGRVRTTYDLLPLLEAPPDHPGWGLLLDPAAYGGAYGPAGVHRGEPAFDAQAYWRGAAWPQVTYLLLLAAPDPVAAGLRAGLIGGATASGFAEYWDPDAGTACGARPQSWAGLALVAARPGDRSSYDAGVATIGASGRPTAGGVGRGEVPRDEA